jgi:hypothetical protein
MFWGVSPLLLLGYYRLLVAAGAAGLTHRWVLSLKEVKKLNNVPRSSSSSSSSFSRILSQKTDGTFGVTRPARA